jgi:MFS family permease
MTVFAFVSISVAIFEVPTGILSDFIGRKKTLILGALAGSLAILFYAIGSSLIMLIIGATFAGLAESFFSGNNEALLYDTLNEHKQKSEFPEFLGRISSVSEISLATAALLGGFLANWSFHLVFWIVLIPQVLSLALSFFIIEPKIHSHEIESNIFSHLMISLKAFKANWNLRNLSLASILDFGISESTNQFTPAFYATLWPVWALGIPKTLQKILGAISFRFSGFFVKKYSAVRVLFISSALSSLFAMMAYIYPTAISPLIIAFTALFFGLMRVSQRTLLHDEFTDKQRATMGSLNNLFGNICFAIFAFIIGYVADSIGPAQTLLLGEILMLSPIFIYWRMFMKPTTK